MYHFTGLRDVPDLSALLDDAFRLKKNPFAHALMGRYKTLGLIFFNPSIRTRLSTQKAAYNLGLEVIVMNIGQDGWQIETQEGAVMDGGKAEHIKDAVGVMGQYCDIIGLRSFAKLEQMSEDYEEVILRKFMEYAGVPVLSLESATRHPLQSLADLLTIEEHKRNERPKVVLTWAPHPRALPQAVANSFVEWMRAVEVELVVTHPPNYRLSDDFMGDLKSMYNQAEAFEGADFIYAKNWSSFKHYGRVETPAEDWQITPEKMALTNDAYFMHCLPVRRNVVVADAVIDGEKSLVLPQAANRVFAAQAVLKQMLSA